MPNFTDERLARFVMLDRFETTESRLLVNDLIAARARIAELEGALGSFGLAVGIETEVRKAEYLDTDNISAFGYPPVQLGWLRRAAAALKGQSNEP